MVAAPADIRTAVADHGIRLIFPNRIIVSLPIIILFSAVVTLKPYAENITVFGAKLGELIDEEIVVFFRAEALLVHIVGRKIDAEFYSLLLTFLGKLLDEIALSVLPR